MSVRAFVFGHWFVVYFCYVFPLKEPPRVLSCICCRVVVCILFLLPMFGLRSPLAQCRKTMQHHHIDVHMRYVLINMTSRLGVK